MVLAWNLLIDLEEGHVEVSLVTGSRPQNNTCRVAQSSEIAYKSTYKRASDGKSTPAKAYLDHRYLE